jgi:hypothetical protein
MKLIIHIINKIMMIGIYKFLTFTVTKKNNLYKLFFGAPENNQVIFLGVTKKNK